MGAAHVAVWNDTYRGIMPDSVLDGMSAEERSKSWLRRLSEPEAGGLYAILVAEQDGGTVGFAACGPQRSDELRARGFAAEFQVINLLVAAQGLGLGRRLMAQMAAAILAQGQSAASLWVVRDNPQARGFYEHLGGRIAGTRVDARLDLNIAEVAYGWADIRGLVTPDSP
jgi:GNAT superfamily N-acetyltransferase